MRKQRASPAPLMRVVRVIAASLADKGCGDSPSPALKYAQVDISRLWLLHHCTAKLMQDEIEHINKLLYWRTGGASWMVSEKVCQTRNKRVNVITSHHLRLPEGEIELLLIMFAGNDGNWINQQCEEGKMKEWKNKPSANRGSCLWEQHKRFSSLAFLLVLQNTKNLNIKIMMMIFCNIITKELKMSHAIKTTGFVM